MVGPYVGKNIVFFDEGVAALPTVARNDDYLY